MTTPQCLQITEDMDALDRAVARDLCRSNLFGNHDSCRKG